MTDGRPRLGGWLRVGIVASVLWAIGAALYQRSVDVDAAGIESRLAEGGCGNAAVRRYAESFRSCILRFPRPGVPRPNCEAEATEAAAAHQCVQVKTQARARELEKSWRRVAAAALIPIPIGWVAGYLLMLLGRWIRAGFKKEGPSE